MFLKPSKLTVLYPKFEEHPSSQSFSAILKVVLLTLLPLFPLNDLILSAVSEGGYRRETKFISNSNIKICNACCFFILLLKHIFLSLN